MEWSFKEAQCQSITGVAEYERWREAKAFNFKPGEHILITGFNSVVPIAVIWERLTPSR